LLQNNNYEVGDEILFDEWQRCFDKNLLPDEKNKTGSITTSGFL